MFNVLGIFGDLFVNLLANGVWVIGGILLTFLGRYFFIVVPSQRLWRFHKPDSVVICTATNKTDTGLYIRPSTGIGQVRALVFIVTSLNKAYKRFDFKRILLSTEQIGHYIENDLILLGGPKNNQVTKLFLEKFDFYNLVNQSDDGSIYWQKTNKVFSGEIKNEVVVKDFGYIVCTRNIFSANSHNRLVLFSGSHTYGTIAAAKYFCETVLKSAKYRQADYVILVSCDVIDGYPVNVQEEDQLFFNAHS
jgi:hypothetical protein